MRSRTDGILLLPFLLLAAGFSPLWAFEPPIDEPGADATAGAAQVPTPAAAPDATPDATKGGDLFRRTLPVDISTATFYDLAAWARSLGLADAGSAAEIRARLYEHYGLAAPAPAGGAGTVVKIEKAGTASYSVVGAEKGGIVRASGGVVLSMTKADGESHRIEADEIVYDRDRNALTARGSVRYERRSGASTEIFTGEALSAGLDDWSGVFLDGKVRRKGEGAAMGERGLVMSAEAIERKPGDILVFDKGVISSCDDEDPHYAIRSGKIWILGDNEWAISNALFSLGHVPLLWLPFFFYPGEEIAFHPVLGYRNREGRFVQTTTYLLGAKPEKAETTSILRIAQGTKGGPTELKGLFLRRRGKAVDAAGAGQDSAPAPASADTLKVMVDLYSGLGAYAGIQGSFPRKAPFDRLEFNAGFGRSRSLFQEYSYSPFVPAGSWESVWNDSRLLGVDLPLRFGLDFLGSVKLGSLSASLAFPLVSDPFFNQDFRNRSEDMDWFGFLSMKMDDSTPPAKMTALSQRLDFTYSLRPKILAPWLGSVDITRLGLSMGWQSKGAPIPTAGSNAYKLYFADPAREFFYPDALRPVDLVANAKGSLFRYPSASPPRDEQAGEGGAGSEPAILLREPWDPGAPAEEDATKAGKEKEAAAEEPPRDFRLPARAPALTVKDKGGLTASVDWSLGPSAFLERRFKSVPWRRPEEIDYKTLYDLFSYRVAGGLDTRAAYRQDLLSGSLVFGFVDQAQVRPVNFDEGSFAAGARAYKLTDLQYQSRRLTGGLRLSTKPLGDSVYWSASNVSYSMDATLYSRKFDAKKGSVLNPLYLVDYLSWDPKSITAHNASFNMVLGLGGLNQSLGLTFSLPPTTESYTAKAVFDLGPFDLSLQERAFRPASGGDLSLDPLTASLSIGASPGPVLGDSLVFDPMKGHVTSNTSSLVYGGFSGSVSAKRAQAYTPDRAAGGWKPEGTQRFMTTDVSLKYKAELKSADKAAVLWSLKADTGLSQSLVRFSDSTMTLGIAASLKVSRFIELTFSSQSQNSAAWCYYPDLFPAVDAIGGANQFRRNLLTDLWESISVWDVSSLKHSLFKLKGLSLKVVHDLHDWDLTVELGAKPLLKQALKTYVLDTSLSILLAWRDLKEIKTQIKADSLGLRY